ncbi:unnamed protein product, partial [marine sediment metagenome]
MTDEKRTAWFVAQRDDLFIIAERDMRDKVFAMDLDNEEFSIIHGSRKAVFGKLLKVDMSPEALLEDLDIREGQRLLLLPAGSGVAG